MRQREFLFSRRFSTGDAVAVSGVPPSTFDKWLAAGLLGEQYTERAGRGVHRTFSVMELLAVVAGVLWAKAGAEPERVHSLISFVAKQNLEYLEAEFGAGRTFCVPPVMLIPIVPVPNTGTFIKPEPTSATAKLFRELDLAACWKDVQAAIAKLPEKRARGRRKRVR
jgi:hypothetical protein